MQLSETVGAVHVAVPVHKPGFTFTVKLLTHPIIVGAILSITVIVNVQLVAIFPEASVAV